FKKVEAFVKHFGGKIFIDEISGLSVITGIEDEDALKTVSSYINKISTTPKQIEIEVRLVDEILSKNNSLTTTTNLGIPIAGGNVSISPDGLTFTTDILNASQYENYLKGLLNSQLSVDHFSEQTSGKSKILAAPRVITTSGEKASIFIGDKEMYVLPGGTPLTQNYGVELTITPTYRPDGTIELDIIVKVSNSAPGNQGGEKLLASQRSREANTKVIIEDGQTIVIGGLMREITEKKVSKLPFLGDLPIIGVLFRSTNEISEKRNLTIFITAKVVRAW
ncbi:MAG: type II and III secretion system protein, partial [Thermotogaceae bacterium]|nr:type II and III secretion system protein [Thermotogaceae bacterium]